VICWEGECTWFWEYEREEERRRGGGACDWARRRRAERKGGEIIPIDAVLISTWTGLRMVDRTHLCVIQNVMYAEIFEMDYWYAVRMYN
jgi:hypothetical protein